MSKKTSILLFSTFKRYLFSLVTFSLLIVSCKVVPTTDPGNQPSSKTIVIDGNSTLPTTFKDQGVAVDYTVKTLIEIKDKTILTVEPGVTIQFEGANSGFFVKGEAALKMIGTQAKPIILEGTNAQKGTWAGVVYEGGKNIENSWEYVTVRHTGGEAALLSDDYYESTISLSNCTFSENTGYGIKLQLTNLKVFSTNTFKNNDKGSAFVFADLMGMMDEKSDFKENGKVYVEVGAEKLTQDMTVHKINVPYRMDNQVQIKSKVTINAGVTIEFLNDASLYIDEYQKNAVLIANGTQSAPIQFLSYLPNNKGVWRGINIQNPHPETKFNYCIIDGSGAGSFFCEDILAGICVGRKLSCPAIASRGIVTNCTFRNCEGYGLAYRESDAPTISGNTFTNCSKGDVLKFK
ncbi:MAG: hypothetical protein RLZZ292_415 [Bacteroidota bacterium]|jgi:parallel beta-helix repeat protein